MTIKEKKAAILRFLNTGKDRFVELNDIIKSYPEMTGNDISQMAESLQSQGYVKTKPTKDAILAKITAEGIEYIENLKSDNSIHYDPDDKIDPSEQEILKEKLDELLERLRKLELGQQVIYDDLADEISDLKDLVGVLGKKDWKQMLLGKLVDAGLGSITGEVSKAITQTFSNQNLLN